MPLPCNNMYCQPEHSRPLPSCLFPGNRYAGCSFRSLFHNRLDSHRYLGLKGWPATSTSMWLQPPPSGGGVRWIATELPQRRPRARFYCELLRTSRTCLSAKSAPQRVATDTNVAFLFSAGAKTEKATKQRGTFSFRNKLKR